MGWPKARVGGGGVLKPDYMAGWASKSQKPKLQAPAGPNPESTHFLKLEPQPNIGPKPESLARMVFINVVSCKPDLNIESPTKYYFSVLLRKPEPRRNVHWAAKQGPSVAWIFRARLGSGYPQV